MQIGSLRASAIAFGVVYIVGLILLGDLLGSSADSTKAFTEQFDSTADRIGHIVGAIALLACALTILTFGLASRMFFARRHPGLATDLIAGLSGLCAAGLLITASLLVTPSLMRTLGELTDDPGIEANSAAAIAQAGTAVFVVTLLVIGVLTVLAGRLAVRNRVISRWVQITGWLVALLTLAGLSVVAAFPMGLWWIAFGISARMDRTAGGDSGQETGYE